MFMCTKIYLFPTVVFSFLSIAMIDVINYMHYMEFEVHAQQESIVVNWFFMSGHRVMSYLYEWLLFLHF